MLRPVEGLDQADRFARLGRFAEQGRLASLPFACTESCVAENGVRRFDKLLAIGMECFECARTHETLECALVDELGIDAAREVGDAAKGTARLANGHDVVHGLASHALYRGERIEDHPRIGI